MCEGCWMSAVEAVGDCRGYGRECGLQAGCSAGMRRRRRLLLGASGCIPPRYGLLPRRPWRLCRCSTYPGVLAERYYGDTSCLGVRGRPPQGQPPLNRRRRWRPRAARPASAGANVNNSP